MNTWANIWINSLTTLHEGAKLLILGIPDVHYILLETKRVL